MTLAHALPLFFASAIGLALLLYVLLDGYDLGIGMLLPFASEDEKDTMIASIGPFWDANETWIVLAVGILLIAFPQAHGMVLTALYVPVTIMLMGLTLRGVAFDFRVKSHSARKGMWNALFALGSLIASAAQGWILGGCVTGLRNDGTAVLFEALLAVTLPATYILLGTAWLLIKTEGALFEKAIVWGRRTLAPAGAGLVLVAVATPLASPTISAKWFTLPNAIGLLPIPLITTIAYAALAWLYVRPVILRGGYHWLVFAALGVICVLASIGLGYSMFPDIVIGRLNLWDAASSTESLLFTFWGTVITLPTILVYTAFIYRVFRGKATALTYD